MTSTTLQNGNPAAVLARTDSLAHRYRDVRRFSLQLSESLEVEDTVVQSMPDVSPTKWHLAHTSWFFEEFVLRKAVPGYSSPHPQYAYLFNSYYVQAGDRHCRPKRGLVTRPTLAETFRYRQHVDHAILSFLQTADEATLDRWAPTVEIGLHHEQQHQELILTDIKHVLWNNPLRPAYGTGSNTRSASISPIGWKYFEDGIYRIGHEGAGFFFDNEGPAHRVFLEPFSIADRLVTNGEYLAFMENGGYERPELWLSEGWNTVDAEDWSAPLYWEKTGDSWETFTLHGMQPVDETEPVTHLSYFEADAFARWADARLPTEAEWEVASKQVPIQGNFADEGHFHPVAANRDGGKPAQMFGDTWEWTSSHYSPYPGYKPLPGAIGEYNGKWMCNQFVLRGGSCATSRSHIRRTYRNFFPAAARWQFTGLRLAKSQGEGDHG